MNPRLDDPNRYDGISAKIKNKRSLQKYYTEIYSKYLKCLRRCIEAGAILELGSGGGFIKEIIPEAVTSDILPYSGVDQVVDATKMSFEDQSLKLICMHNVLHHIADAEAFFKEADRCLKPGGRVFITDQYIGWLSRPIYRYLHHEPCNAKAKDWKFKSSGPLSSANGALAWIIFVRDRIKFSQKFSKLEIVKVEPHSPLRYWLSGGLKNWTLLPGIAFEMATALDRLLISISKSSASFLDIEIVKRA